MATDGRNAVCTATLLFAVLLALLSTVQSKRVTTLHPTPLHRRSGRTSRQLLQFAEDDNQHHQQGAPSPFHHEAVSGSRWADTRWRPVPYAIQQSPGNHPAPSGGHEYDDQREQRDLARHQLDRYTAGFAAPPIDSGIVEGGPHEEHRQQRVAHPLNGKYRMAPDYQADPSSSASWSSQPQQDNGPRQGTWDDGAVGSSATSPDWGTPVFNPEAVPRQYNHHHPVHAQPRAAIPPLPVDARFLVSDGDRPSRASLGAARRIESFPTLQNQPGREYEDAIMRRTVTPTLPTAAPAHAAPRSTTTATWKTTTSTISPKPATTTSKVVSTTSKFTSTTSKVVSTTPKVTTTTPKVTTTSPKVTTTSPKVTTTSPKVTTTASTTATSTKASSAAPNVNVSTLKATAATSPKVVVKVVEISTSPKSGLDDLDVTMGDFPESDTSTFVDDNNEPSIGTMFDLSEDFTEDHLTVRIAYPSPSSESVTSPAPPAGRTDSVPDVAVVSEYTASEDFVGTVTMSEYVATTTTSEWTESIEDNEDGTTATAITTGAPTAATTTNPQKNMSTTAAITTSVRPLTSAPETSAAAKIVMETTTKNVKSTTNVPATATTATVPATSVESKASVNPVTATTTAAAAVTVSSPKSKTESQVLPNAEEVEVQTPPDTDVATRPAPTPPAPRPTSRRRLPSYRPSIIRHRVNRPTAAPEAPAATWHPRPTTPRPTRSWMTTVAPATTTEEEMTDWNTPAVPTEPTTTKRTYVITVPPLVDPAERSRQRHAEASLDGELGATQLSEPTEDHGHGVIPEGATNAIIISGIIGGCAIVFFAVLMAFCMWRQHMSRRPIYPPSDSSNSSSSTPSSGTFNGKFR